MPERISFDTANQLQVPDFPIIPFIKGDGIGNDIWPAAKRVLDAAVKSAFHSQRKIKWLEIIAGEKSHEKTGQWLSDEALSLIKDHRVVIKGPLSIPTEKGIENLDTRIRHRLDLYACVRPVKYLPPIFTSVQHPEKIDIVVFRENIEKSRPHRSIKLLELLKSELNCELPLSRAMGLKPMSQEKIKRLVIKAFEYAVENHRKSVTLMHNGNVMKFAAGGVEKWGYKAAFERFGHLIISEEEVFEKYEGLVPDGRVIIKDRIADMIFPEILLRPGNFDVIVCPDLNGVDMSDTLTARVGGGGMMPGADIGDDCAVFKTTHGTLPHIAGKDVANPCSLILSGAMMLDHMGWQAAGDCVRKGVANTLGTGKVTADLVSRISRGEQVTCSRFSRIITEHILYQH
ncbi:MAG: NADP-dependent isocitrate dehydrogenase [Proteobacteria bacterium]|nr:NADP-dependent isocitrate dehydrogenase [Pseudomonadota bacterium]MBU1582298.1 NADP-dependent isocitrate dehydrogenase [Pseudomonadota bacterium]MBU2452400.1 NADP-dependent isocitrate dehydrogenase [Pseudomonadota bacterium]MBU2627168.1 NADP-dependent isocitrate dehydrogenase [Pseudomonadota bacterium]